MAEPVASLRVGSTLVACRVGQVVLEALQSAGCLVQSACSGRGVCGLCRVRVCAGKASEPTGIESRFISDDERHRGLRLACQMRLVASVAITLPNIGSTKAQDIE